MAGHSSSIISIAGTDLSPELTVETSPSTPPPPPTSSSSLSSSSYLTGPSQSPALLVSPSTSATITQECPFTAGCTLGSRLSAPYFSSPTCLGSDAARGSGRQQQQPITTATLSIVPVDLQSSSLSPASPTASLSSSSPSSHPSYVYAVPGDHCYYYYPCQPELLLEDGSER